MYGATLESIHSLSEQNRQQGVHQVEERRESILNAAQRLFLAYGLETVSMVDIAEAGGHNKSYPVSLFSQQGSNCF